MQKQNLFKILLILIFPIYYLTINYYYRYAFDDFGFLHCVNTDGALRSTLFYYFHTEGAFFGFLEAHLFYYLPPFFHFTSFIIILYFSFYFFLVSLWKNLAVQYSRIDLFCISSLFLAGFYFISPQITELWHWMNANFYLFVYCHIFFALGFMLRKKIVYATPFLIMIMQSKIVWALILFGFYCIFTFGLYLKEKKINKKYFFVGLLMLLALIIYIAAPGNWALRKDRLSHVFTDEININFWLAIKNVWYTLIIKKISYVIIFFTPIVFLVGDEFIRKIKLKAKYVLIPFIVLMLSIITNSLLFHIAVGGYFVYARVWHLQSFLFAFVFLYYYLQIFLYLKEKAFLSIPILFQSFKLIAVFCSGVYVYIFTKSLMVNLPIVKTYAAEYDNRITIVENCKLQKGETLYLEPLPDSGILMDWGVSDYPWHRKSFRHLYDLKCDLEIKKLQEK